MSEQTFIEWTDHTGGPWLVCTEVSPGCAKCYARELLESRLAPIIRKAYKAAGLEDWETRRLWGPTAPRVKTKGFWREAFRFNARARDAKVRTSVFPSMIDWLDDMPAGAIDQDGKWLDRDELLGEFLWVVKETPWINWLLLTKRVEDFHDRLAAVGDKISRCLTGRMHDDAKAAAWLEAWRMGIAPDNVALGVSAEDQARWDDRVPELMGLPSVVKFVSAEPLLAPIDMETELAWRDANDKPAIDMVILGGESGSGCRKCALAWLRSGVRQCRTNGARVFVKQLGGNLTDADLDECARLSGKSMHHPKGGEPSEWPEELRARDPWPEMGRAA